MRRGRAKRRQGGQLGGGHLELHLLVGILGSGDDVLNHRNEHEHQVDQAEEQQDPEENLGGPLHLGEGGSQIGASQTIEVLVMGGEEVQHGDEQDDGEHLEGTLEQVTSDTGNDGGEDGQQLTLELTVVGGGEDGVGLDTNQHQGHGQEGDVDHVKAQTLRRLKSGHEAVDVAVARRHFVCMCFVFCYSLFYHQLALRVF
jgi:hypothetical protein